MIEWKQERDGKLIQFAQGDLEKLQINFAMPGCCTFIQAKIVSFLPYTWEVRRIQAFTKLLVDHSVEVCGWHYDFRCKFMNCNTGT